MVSISIFTNFFKNRSGNFAVTFSVIAVPLFMIIGLALNFTMAYQYKSQLQQATDAATLAAAAETGVAVSEEQRTKVGTEFFMSNFDTIPAEISFEYSEGTVIGSASYKMPLILGKIFGSENIAVHAKAVVGIPEDSAVELVMVLDYSGSMNWNGKYISMRDAAIGLLDVFKNSPGSAKIKVGLVPFSEYVLTDIDASYIRVVHPSHYGETARACLGSRFSPFATDGNTPDKNNEDSKWPTIGLPDYFATAGAEKQEMSCATDKKGKQICEICTTTVDAKGRTKNKCKAVNSEKVAKGGIKAVQEKALSAYALSDPECQNYFASNLLSQPLTNNLDVLINQLRLAKPVELTNIALAMDVGWHLISPQAPFTQGEGKFGSKPKRFVVLFTDGAQTVPGYGDGNGNNGQGNGGADSYTIQQAEENTAELCRKIHSDGIEVMTIAFQLGTGKARNQMRDCASKLDYFFETQSQEDLAGIFSDIASLTVQKLYLQK